MYILAVDPGFERIGIAIIKKNSQSSAEELVYSTCFKTSSKIIFNERLLLIGKKLEKIIKKYKPQTLAIETLFFVTNQKTAMRVSEARGVIIYEAKKRGLTIVEYTPLQIKVAMTGYGKATKDQMAIMIKKLINLKKKIKSDDEMDAIAIGLTCFAYKKI